ncbi:MAG TPA: RidA family protein [Nitrososphaerales archaeon]|nr:RidA family protein [Nitrososphaerales archaeon]
MPKEVIRPSGLYDPSPLAYSHAVKVGDVVYLAGQLAVEGSGQKIVGAGDVVVQARQIFANMAKIVESAGGGLAEIVQMTVFLKNIKDLPSFLEVRKEVFKKDFPASTAVQVVGFAAPEALVEVNAVAVIDSRR